MQHNNSQLYTVVFLLVVLSFAGFILVKNKEIEAFYANPDLYSDVYDYSVPNKINTVKTQKGTETNQKKSQQANVVLSIPKVIQSLYDKYKDGSIAECLYNNHVVYSASVNAYDSGATIYDANEIGIGTVNGSDGKMDSVAQDVKDCKDIYVVDKNIWGKKAVNIYNLK